MLSKVTYLSPAAEGVPSPSLVMVICWSTILIVRPPSNPDQESKEAIEISKPPGKVIFILPSLGIIDAVVNLVVCFPDTDTTDDQGI